jgi:hypothetical protein
VVVLSMQIDTIAPEMSQRNSDSQRGMASLGGSPESMSRKGFQR